MRDRNQFSGPKPVPSGRGVDQDDRTNDAGWRQRQEGMRMAVIENEKASRFPDAELKARAAWHY
ncbi:MAG: hypothetical protein E5W21_36760, partial [Mesorhizobium sp.]